VREAVESRALPDPLCLTGPAHPAESSTSRAITSWPSRVATARFEDVESLDGIIKSVYVVYTIMKAKHRLVWYVKVKSPTTFMKSLKEEPAEDIINIRVNPNEKETLVRLLGDEVKISRFIKSAMRAYILHERKRDGENLRYFSILGRD
jgi:hypothetical protein